MRKENGFKSKENLKTVTDLLDRYYVVLKESLRGDEPTGDELLVPPRQHIPHLYVEPVDVRGAIEGMIGVLKEIKKTFK